MTETNLSCVLYGPGKVRFEDRPVPEIDDPHDVLIRISYVGVCGSDVHFWTHGGITRMVSDEAPLVMGHEASGIIHSVGAAVTNLQIGDRVAIEPGFPCRRCQQCKTGRYNLCPGMRFAADPPDTHGTLCRLFRMPADFVYKIPASLSLEEAVLVEPLAVAVHGVRRADVRPGQTVLVQGAGTIGLLTAAVAIAYGASVKSVGITDVNEAKLDFAREYLGCTALRPDTEATPRAVAAQFKKEMSLENGVNVVLECTGVEASAQAGIYALAAGGVFVQIGLGKPLQAFPLLDMFEKETVFKTSFRYAPRDYEIALDLLDSEKVDLAPLVSSTVPFERASEAWEKTRRGEGIKNLIQGVQE
ncbi:NAD(P)-dependent alcohol dehydrogenase [Aspergillus homomorphus CBS 101889]|uniref:D-xylulose reductase n=1 Tax=Aspergillus homomorphus (strain CBS 101889) TaxID=1450537 RepID=A0A395IEP7_ASPHC|nr:GroES-like protein [Aspergillus homomorphus CBS 101889]RAL17638.1 GroES-like protein [Aspergillus homomorphus CBS 101889]